MPEIVRRSFVEPSAVFVVWFIAAWPFLDPSTSVYGFDTLAYTGPNLQTTFDAWRGFSLPLWQADVFGGVPFLGRLGSQGLYLPHLPLMLFDVNTALDFGAAFHLLVLGAGMYTLVRWVYGMRAPAGFVSASSVLASSYIAIKMLSYDQMVAIAWIPWILICIELIIRHPKRVSFAGPLAMVTSFLILGGHPQFIYFAAIMVISYAVLRLLDTRSWKSIMTMAVGGTLTVALTSLQLVAAYFLNSSSGISSKRSLAALADPAYVLPPSRIPIGVFGDPFVRNPTQVTGVAEAVLGLGLPVCVLAVIGTIFGRKLGAFTRYGSALGCLLGISLAVGPRWMPFRVLYDVVPGFGAARVAGRWLVIPLILGAILAAEGVGVIAIGKRAVRPCIAFAGLSLVGFGLLLVGPFEVPGAGVLIWWTVALVSVVILLSGLIKGARQVLVWTWVAAFVGLGAFVPLRHTPAINQRSNILFDAVDKPLVKTISEKGGRVFAQTFDRFDNPPYLLEHLRPNTNALVNVASVDGYDGGQWIQKRWVDMAESLTNGKFATDLNIRSQTRFPLSADLLRRFGVRWALVDSSVLPADQQLDGFTGPIGRSGDVELWENPKWIGHAIAYLKSETRDMSLGDQLRLVSPDAVIVDDQSHAIDCEGECFAQGVSALYEADDRGAYIFNIASDGILALDQGWSPDWKVYVDGSRTSAFPVNGNQVGVHFAAGYHKVEFRYDPVWVNPLLALGIMALLVSLVMCVGAIRKVTPSNETVSSDASQL